VPEDADKAGKKGFVDYKRVVWHKSFKVFLKKMLEYEKTGVDVLCGDNIWRLIVPIILILCADYEEQ
jgi:Plavaka transposase